MRPFLRCQIPCALNKYAVAASLRQISIGDRLTLDDRTYILRQGDRYIAYRMWMSVLPMIEVFGLSEEIALIQWLEQFGYLFE